MTINFSYQNRGYKADLSQPLDISIPLEPGLNTVNCFYAPPMEVSPVVAGDFIGSTAAGGPVNFMNVRLNPHGNGTHTECVGHIAKEPYSLNKSLLNFHFMSRLISLFPSKLENGDRVILPEQLMSEQEKPFPEAVIIRTLPNDELKLKTNYSGANPPYLHHKSVHFLVEQGVEHLLIDLPSVDREEDGGALLSHRAFWQYPESVRSTATITELIYVPNSVKDGYYLLNLQTASFDIDVSPSRPVLYTLEEFS